MKRDYFVAFKATRATYGGIEASFQSEPLTKEEAEAYASSLLRTVAKEASVHKYTYIQELEK